MENTAYTSHVLDNGLTVLLRENHSAPIISYWIWYRVGARNEVPGKTGISHLVEHMQFKGTKTFPGLEPANEIYRNGGIMNAETGLDWTVYYETMPAERIGAVIEMEADRMVNSLFDPKEAESEKNVILSERIGADGEKIFRLLDAMRKAAFPHHPYGRNPYGEIEDLYRLTCDDIYEHYRTWYVPNNAVITAAGDFNTDEMLRRIEAAFGNIPPRPVPLLNIPQEQPVSGPLRLEVHGYGDLNDLRLYWQVPGAKSSAIPALVLLNSILTGPRTLNSFDENSFPNRTSRLFRKLVSSGMSAALVGDYLPTLDPYILSISTLINPGVNTEDVRGAIFEELEGIARNGVLPAEIEKARKQMRAVLAYAAEDINTSASWMGFSSMLGDPGWHIGLPERLENVRPEDISRAAGTILRRDNCVTGIFIPEKE